MHLSPKSDQSVATEEVFGAFGIGLVNVVAGALGITALPGPATHLLWPGWFVWQPFMQRLEFKSAVGIEPGFFKEYVIDSKAMRKVKEDESLMGMLELKTPTGASFALTGRILVKGA